MSFFHKLLLSSLSASLLAFAFAFYNDVQAIKATHYTKAEAMREKAEAERERAKEYRLVVERMDALRRELMEKLDRIESKTERVNR